MEHRSTTRSSIVMLQKTDVKPLLRLFLGVDYRVENMNGPAAELFRRDGPGDDRKAEGGGGCVAISLLSDELCRFARTGEEQAVFEKVLPTLVGDRNFEVRLRRMQDVSGKFCGTVVILFNMTERHRAAAAVREREERFRALLENAQDIITIVESDGRIRFESPSVHRVLGYAPSELEGRSAFDFLHPEDQKAVLRIFEAGSRMSGAVERCVFRFRHADGSWRYLDAIGRNLLDDPVIKGIVINSRDITEQKLAEETLRKRQDELVQQHEKLNRLFDQVQIAKRQWEMTMDCVEDMVMLIDGRGEVRRCNAAVRAFTGTDYAEVRGRNWIELLREQGIDAGEDLRRQAELHDSHRKRWFLLHSYDVPGVFASGLGGTVVTIHDVSETKKLISSLEVANAELDAERRELRNALDGISSLMQQVIDRQDLSLRIENRNLKKCWEIMGCNNESCVCFGAEADRCWQKAGTLCGGREQGVFAQKLGNCEACPVYTLATSTPSQSIGEHFNNMMRLLEEKNAELQNAYEELKRTQAKILQSEKMASIGQFAAGIAHEINNPMGFIASNLGTLGKYTSRIVEFLRLRAEALQKAEPQAASALEDRRKGLKVDYGLDDFPKLIAESLDGADCVKTIVQDLKNFSRVDQAEYKLANINECLDTTINIVWNELKYKTTLHRDYAEVPMPRCYPQQLNQVFMNLLINAAQAIETRGDITVTTRSGGGLITVSVAGTGKGIPPETLNRIFDPFLRPKNRARARGSA